MHKVFGFLRLFPLIFFLCLPPGSLKGELPSEMNALSPHTVFLTPITERLADNICEGGLNIVENNFYGPILDKERYINCPEGITFFSLVKNQEYFTLFDFFNHKAVSKFFPVAEHKKIFETISENLRQFFLNVLEQAVEKAGAQISSAEWQDLKNYVNYNHFGLPIPVVSNEKPVVPNDETVVKIAAKLENHFPFAKEVKLKIFPEIPGELFLIVKVQDPDNVKDPSSKVELVIPFSNRALREFLGSFYVTDLPESMKNLRNHHVVGDFYPNDNRFAFFVPFSLPIFLKDQGFLEYFLLGVYIQHVLINSFFYRADGSLTMQKFLETMEIQRSAYAKEHNLKPENYAFQETNAASLEKSVLEILQGLMPSPYAISLFHDFTKVITFALSLIDAKAVRSTPHTFQVDLVESFLYIKARLIMEGKIDSIDIWNLYRSVFTFTWDPDPRIKEKDWDKERFERIYLLKLEDFKDVVTKMFSDPNLKEIYGQVEISFKETRNNVEVILDKLEKLVLPSATPETVAQSA